MARAEEIVNRAKEEAWYIADTSQTKEEAIATGQTVKMRYFSEGVEHEIEGVVRVKGYKYRQHQFCVETPNGIRYPFSLMEKPSKQIVMIKDFQYARDRTKI